MEIRQQSGGLPAAKLGTDFVGLIAASMERQGRRTFYTFAVVKRSAGKSVTIDDVALAAGVSRAAVSKVIRNAYGVSPAMRDKVGRAIAELDYRPSVAARAMRGSSYRLGLEIPHVSATFMTQIVEGAKQALTGTPYQLVLAPADGPGYSTLAGLADGLVDGIVAIAPLVDPDWLEDLSKTLPIVMLGRHDGAHSYDTVVGDDVAGAHLVMDHLLSLGHRRIAHLTEVESVTAPGTKTPHALRLQVYSQRMAEAGLSEYVRLGRTAYGPEGARVAGDQLMAEAEPPTAIFAGHDDLAIAALASVADTGRPFGEVSVVGYDNTTMSAHPLISLTTVDQRGVEMGLQAVTMLLERINGRTEHREYMAAPSLCIRNSTGPPRES